MKYVLGLIILAGLAYHGVWNLGFTNYDDKSLISDRLSWLNTNQAYLDAFKQDVFMDASAKRFYRPILTWSFILDTQVWGTNAFGYHVTNWLYHIIACLLAYTLLGQLKFNQKQAFVGASIMAIHPLLSGAVAWIPGRNDTLLTIFILLATLAYLKDKWWLHFGLLELAILTKETAILFPIIALMLSRKHLLLKIIGWSIVYGIYFGLRSLAPMARGSGMIEMGIESIKNIPGVLSYFGKMIWPTCLNGLPLVIDMRDKMIAGVLILVMVIVTAIRNNVYRDTKFSLGIAWFVVWLLPTLVPINSASLSLYFLEHRLYLPVIGLVICGLVMIKKLNKYFIGFMGLVLMGVTTLQVNTYKDPITFWQHTTACTPHAAMAWVNLGTTYYSEGLGLDKAEAALKRAIEINPSMEFAHGNLASVFFDQGRYDEALGEIKAEQLTIISADNYFMTGAINERLGNILEAVNNWEKALAMNPDDWRSNMAMTQYYFFNNNLKMALPYYQKAKNKGIVFSEEIERAMAN
jgi:protein O-mannosyl-transferase